MFAAVRRSFNGPGGVGVAVMRVPWSLSSSRVSVMARRMVVRLVANTRARMATDRDIRRCRTVARTRFGNENWGGRPDRSACDWPNARDLGGFAAVIRDFSVVTVGDVWSVGGGGCSGSRPQLG